MTASKRQQQVLENIARMLERREICPAKTALEAFSQSFDELQGTATWNNIRVKIIQDSVKNLNKTPGLLSFVQQTTGDGRCFVVVNNIFCQPFKALMALGNVEVFWTFELVKDLYSNVLIPKHRVLSASEKEQVMREYQVRTKEVPRIDKTEFVSRYLGLKVGDWVEIERPSLTSGISVAYRVVTNCSWDSLFR